MAMQGQMDWCFTIWVRGVARPANCWRETLSLPKWRMSLLWKQVRSNQRDGLAVKGTNCKGGDKSKTIWRLMLWLLPLRTLPHATPVSICKKMTPLRRVQRAQRGGEKTKSIGKQNYKICETVWNKKKKTFVSACDGKVKRPVPNSL